MYSGSIFSPENRKLSQRRLKEVQAEKGPNVLNDPETSSHTRLGGNMLETPLTTVISKKRIERDSETVQESEKMTINDEGGIRARLFQSPHVSPFGKSYDSAATTALFSPPMTMSRRPHSSSSTYISLDELNYPELGSRNSSIDFMSPNRDSFLDEKNLNRRNYRKSSGSYDGSIQVPSTPQDREMEIELRKDTMAGISERGVRSEIPLAPLQKQIDFGSGDFHSSAVPSDALGTKGPLNTQRDSKREMDGGEMSKGIFGASEGRHLERAFDFEGIQNSGEQGGFGIDELDSNPLRTVEVDSSVRISLFRGVEPSDTLLSKKYYLFSPPDGSISQQTSLTSSTAVEIGHEMNMDLELRSQNEALNAEIISPYRSENQLTVNKMYDHIRDEAHLKGSHSEIHSTDVTRSADRLQGTKIGDPNLGLLTIRSNSGDFSTDRDKRKEINSLAVPFHKSSDVKEHRLSAEYQGSADRYILEHSSEPVVEEEKGTPLITFGGYNSIFSSPERPKYMSETTPKDSVFNRISHYNITESEIDSVFLSSSSAYSTLQPSITSRDPNTLVRRGDVGYGIIKGESGHFAPNYEIESSRLSDVAYQRPTAPLRGLKLIKPRVTISFPESVILLESLFHDRETMILSFKVMEEQYERPIEADVKCIFGALGGEQVKTSSNDVRRLIETWDFSRGPPPNVIFNDPYGRSRSDRFMFKNMIYYIQNMIMMTDTPTCSFREVDSSQNSVLRATLESMKRLPLQADFASKEAKDARDYRVDISSQEKRDRTEIINALTQKIISLHDSSMYEPLKDGENDLDSDVNAEFVSSDLISTPDRLFQSSSGGQFDLEVTRGLLSLPHSLTTTPVRPRRLSQTASQQATFSPLSGPLTSLDSVHPTPQLLSLLSFSSLEKPTIKHSSQSTEFTSAPSMQDATKSPSELTSNDLILLRTPRHPRGLREYLPPDRNSEFICANGDPDLIRFDSASQQEIGFETQQASFIRSRSSSGSSSDLGSLCDVNSLAAPHTDLSQLISGGSQPLIDRPEHSQRLQRRSVTVHVTPIAASRALQLSNPRSHKHCSMSPAGSSRLASRLSGGFSLDSPVSSEGNGRLTVLQKELSGAPYISPLRSGWSSGRSLTFSGSVPRPGRGRKARPGAQLLSSHQTENSTAQNHTSNQRAPKDLGRHQQFFRSMQRDLDAGKGENTVAAVPAVSEHTRLFTPDSSTSKGKKKSASGIVGNTLTRLVQPPSMEKRQSPYFQLGRGTGGSFRGSQEPSAVFDSKRYIFPRSPPESAWSRSEDSGSETDTSESTDSRTSRAPAGQLRLSIFREKASPFSSVRLLSPSQPPTQTLSLSHGSQPSLESSSTGQNPLKLSLSAQAIVWPGCSGDEPTREVNENIGKTTPRMSEGELRRSGTLQNPLVNGESACRTLEFTETPKKDSEELMSRFNHLRYSNPSIMRVSDSNDTAISPSTIGRSKGRAGRRKKKRQRNSDFTTLEKEWQLIQSDPVARASAESLFAIFRVQKQTESEQLADRGTCFQPMKSFALPDGKMNIVNPAEADHQILTISINDNDAAAQGHCEEDEWENTSLSKDMNCVETSLTFPTLSSPSLSSSVANNVINSINSDEQGTRRSRRQSDSETLRISMEVPRGDPSLVVTGSQNHVLGDSCATEKPRKGRTTTLKDNFLINHNFLFVGDNETFPQPPLPFHYFLFQKRLYKVFQEQESKESVTAETRGADNVFSPLEKEEEKPDWFESKVRDCPLPDSLLSDHAPNKVPLDNYVVSSEVISSDISMIESTSSQISVNGTPSHSSPAAGSNEQKKKTIKEPKQDHLSKKRSKKGKKRDGADIKFPLSKKKKISRKPQE